MTNKEKLKEAAVKKLCNYECESLNSIDADQFEGIVTLLQSFATSEAAREYWQQQQAPDMEEIRKSFEKFTVDNMGNQDFTDGSVWNFFAPFIKGSDAKTLDEVGISIQKYLHVENTRQYYVNKNSFRIYEEAFTPDQLRAIANHMEKQTKKG